MEMSIDDAILCLKGIKQYGSDTFTKRSQGDWQNSLDMAIETMRKYQKIEEILNSAGYIENSTVYSYTYDEDSRVKHIREVVEDGNDD